MRKYKTEPQTVKEKMAAAVKAIKPHPRTEATKQMQALLSEVDDLIAEAKVRSKLRVSLVLTPPHSQTKALMLGLKRTLDIGLQMAHMQAAAEKSGQEYKTDQDYVCVARLVAIHHSNWSAFAAH